MKNLIHEIDWGRNIVLMIIYVVAITLCLIFYFIPVLNEHKLQTINYKRSHSISTAVNQSKSSLKNSMETLLAENHQEYNNIRNKINVGNVTKYINMHLTNAKVIDNGETKQDDDTTIQRISIRGTAKDTKSIIDLINTLSALHNSIKVTLPISITKQKKLLDVQFTIEAYYSDYKL